MAAPFLPPPDVLRPDDVEVDPDLELAELGWLEVAARVDPDAVAEQVAADDKRWRITDPDVAEWAMAKLADARADLAQLTRQRDSYAQRIDQWFWRATEASARQASFFEGQLILWALTERSRTKADIKTAKLPSGEIRTRKAGPWRASITDPAALLEWAIDRRDDGTNIVRSKLVLDVLVSALNEISVVCAGDGDAMVVVDAETGERIPGAGATQTAGSVTVVPYEYD